MTDKTLRVRGLLVVGGIIGLAGASCVGINPTGVATVPGSTNLDFGDSKEPVPPIPTEQKLDPAVVALGSKLFHDKRLSGDGTIACASCHGLDTGGTDQAKHSTGIQGKQGGINAPTVLNAAFNFVQFWNGRAASLEEQAGGPVNNPGEMGSNWPHACGEIKKDPEMAAKFKELFGTDPTPETVEYAIATFERSCTTPNAPFDRYLRGDSSALDAAQKHGWALFKSYGCVSCHQGVNMGGNMYEKLGVMDDYFRDRGTPETDADQGRYAVTKRQSDMHVFKVPSLRNIALTAPYFHDGSATTLPQAVEVMAQYQLGRPMDPADLADLVQFLQSLTGDQPTPGKEAGK